MKEQTVYKVGLSDSNFIARGIEFKGVKPNYYYIEADGVVDGKPCTIFGNLDVEQLRMMTKGTRENEQRIAELRKVAERARAEYKTTRDPHQLEEARSLEEKIKDFVYITKLRINEPRYTYAEIFVKHAKKLKHGIPLKRAQRLLEQGNWRKLNKLLKKDVKFKEEKFKSFIRL